MTTGIHGKHERMPMDAKAMADLRNSAASAQQGIDTNKMKKAVGNLVSRQNPKKFGRGFVEREVEVGRLQDAKNLAAMMKRQRTGR